MPQVQKEEGVVAVIKPTQTGMLEMMQKLLHSASDTEKWLAQYIVQKASH